MNEKIILGTILNWPTAIIVALGVLVLLLYRPPEILKETISRLRKFRRGKTEIELEKEQMPATEEPKVDTAETIAAEVTEQAEKEEKAEEESLQDKAFEAFLAKDYEKFKSLMDQAAEGEEDEEKKCRILCVKFDFLSRFAGEAVLPGLMELREKFKKCYRPPMLIGEVYKRAEEYETAIGFFQEALHKCAEENEKFSIELEICETQRLGKFLDDARNRLTQLERQRHSAEDFSRIYEEWGNLWLAKDQDLKAQEHFEKALKCDPENFWLRFDTAYRYSEMTDCDEKALYHYRILYDQKPDYSYTRNNLAIQYLRMDMPIKAVKNFKQAAEQGQSVAMGNIAIQLIEKGFIEEAQEWIEKASKCEEVDAKVGRAIERIEDRLKEEQEEEEEIMKKFSKPSTEGKGK